MTVTLKSPIFHNLENFNPKNFCYPILSQKCSYIKTKVFSRVLTSKSKLMRSVSPKSRIIDEKFSKTLERPKKILRGKSTGKIRPNQLAETMKTKPSSTLDTMRTIITQFSLKKINVNAT